MPGLKYILATKRERNSSSRQQPINQFILHLLALLLFVLCFTGTTLVLFPKAQLKDHVDNLIRQQTIQQISIGELSLSPLVRAEAKNIVWKPGNKAWPPVVVDHLSLSPLWTTLFGNNPEGHFHASVSEGTIDGRASKDGSFTATLAGINLAPLIASDFAFPPTGTLGGTVATEELSGTNVPTVGVDLAIKNLRVAGLDRLGLTKSALSLGDLILRGKLTGQTFTLETLQNEGGDLSLSTHGTILLNDKPERCRLNLQIEMHPGVALAPTFQDLIQLTELKADANGSYKFRLSGTLTRPLLR